MREGIEELNIEKEEENLENTRAKIKEIKNEALKELKQGGRVEYWPGINPKHLDKSDLEVFALFNKEELNWGEFDEKVKAIWDGIGKEENKDKKNSRQNFIDWLRQKANNKLAGEQLNEEREKENI